MRWLLLLTFMAACGGGGSFLGTELDKKVAAVDARFKAGDVEGGCAALRAVIPELSEWMMSMRGNRAGAAVQAVQQMEEITFGCDPQLRTRQTTGDLAARWTTAHQALRGSARHKSSWGTVLWWGLIVGAVLGVGVFLRRWRS